MAVRLGIPKEPYWLDLGYGVRLLVKPPTTPVYNEARQTAAIGLREVLDARQTIEEAGAEVADLPNLETEAGRVAFYNFCFVRALAQAAVIDWEGVLDEDGAEAPVTPSTVRQLVEFHTIAEGFIAAFAKPVLDRLVEGNGSALSPAGTSVEGAKPAPVVH